LSCFSHLSFRGMVLRHIHQRPHYLVIRNLIKISIMCSNRTEEFWRFEADDFINLILQVPEGVGWCYWYGKDKFCWLQL